MGSNIPRIILVLTACLAFATTVALSAYLTGTSGAEIPAVVGSNLFDESRDDDTVTLFTHPKRQDQSKMTKLLSSIDDLVQNTQTEDRGAFTREFVSNMSSINTYYNYIICHVAHAFKFEGTEGVDWGHKNINSKGYDYTVVIGRAGLFVREGDGGYVNWAFSGIVEWSGPIGGAAAVIFRDP